MDNICSCLIHLDLYLFCSCCILLLGCLFNHPLLRKKRLFCFNALWLCSITWGICICWFLTTLVWTFLLNMTIHGLFSFPLDGFLPGYLDSYRSLDSGFNLQTLLVIGPFCTGVFHSSISRFKCIIVAVPHSHCFNHESSSAAFFLSAFFILHSVLRPVSLHSWSGLVNSSVAPDFPFSLLLHQNLFKSKHVSLNSPNLPISCPLSCWQMGLLEKSRGRYWCEARVRGMQKRILLRLYPPPPSWEPILPF